jgi:superfamily II DNA/RNA helicase
METGNGIIEATANIPNEEKKIKELIELVDEGPDRKFDTLIRAIEQIRRENKNEKMIIFTQYLETLYFLQDEIGKYSDPKKIAIIKGGPLENKIASCESFWDEDGAQFLISTSAGGEGINLQLCRILFNYDLPWNPMAVEQRIGRIHRYGQTETVQVYHLVAEETIEEKVYAILDKKLFEIAMTIGKADPVTGSVSEDFRSEILGFLGSSTNYTFLYREALLYRNYERTEQEITEVYTGGERFERSPSSTHSGPLNLQFGILQGTGRKLYTGRSETIYEKGDPAIRRKLHPIRRYYSNNNSADFKKISSRGIPRKLKTKQTKNASILFHQTHYSK